MSMPGFTAGASLYRLAGNYSQIQSSELSGGIVPGAFCPPGFVGKVVCNVEGHCGVVCVPVLPPPPPACPIWLPGWVMCGTNCVNLNNDANNCGSCGHFCPIGSVGRACCSGACVDRSSDTSNCGACGNVCPAPPNSTNVTCTGIVTGGMLTGVCDFSCDSGYTKCGSIGCFDIQTDVNNCGSCGKVCPQGPANSHATCTNGVCGFACDQGFSLSNGICCPSGEFNSDGICCPAGEFNSNGICCIHGEEVNCGEGKCINTLSDPNNCGGCRMLCASGICCKGKCCRPPGINSTTKCENGVCTNSCNPGYISVNGVCTACPPGLTSCSGKCVTPTCSGACPTGSAQEYYFFIEQRPSMCAVFFQSPTGLYGPIVANSLGEATKCVQKVYPSSSYSISTTGGNFCFDVSCPGDAGDPPSCSPVSNVLAISVNDAKTCTQLLNPGCTITLCPKCAEGLTDCCGTCVDTSSDAKNCGSCQNQCASGTSCINGFCQ